MHPKIKAFWVNAGYTLVELYSTWAMLGKPSNNPYNYFSIAEPINNTLRYRFSQHSTEWYLEEKALRLIKMKAFL